MCGICGIVRFDGKTPDQGLLDRMTDALAHRGPDGRGTWTEGNAGLGHRRLKIIDLSEAAAQPMRSKDGRYVIVFNGEIYNFQEQRKKLQAQGHAFTSTGDTDVLLRLYEVHGERCVDFLRGMFAFAIMDRAKKTLFLARDRVGKKPIKYFLNNGVFAFASEEKSLKLLPECPREIDWEALHHFLSLTYIPSPLTGIKGLMKLPAAHTLMLDLTTGKFTTKRYWAMEYRPVHGRSLPEWKDRIMETLKESVRLRMIADVPVGAFLSGGIDSSTVVALMSKLHPEPIKTFSIGSKSALSELPDADRVARAFGTDHHPIMLEPDIVKLLPTLVETYEEPVGDPSVIPTYLVSQFTRETVTVALSGDGGDEGFGGYLRYPILRFSEQWNRLPGVLRSAVRGGTHVWHRLMNNTLSYRAKLFHDSLLLPWPERVQQYMGALTEEEKRELYANLERPRIYPEPSRGTGAHQDAAMEGRSGFSRTDQWFAGKTADARTRGDDLIHQSMNADLETYLPDDLMPKVDLGAMAHGLEVRAPFLDHELLELTAELPSDLQVRGWKTKWILKEILKDLLPPETLTKKKQGFRLPLDEWFRGELKSYVRERLGEGHPLLWKMLDREKIGVFLDEYYTSSIDRSSQVWMLLWLREWFERQP